MRLKIYVLLAIFYCSNSILGQEGFCRYWHIEPKLYNNYICDTTSVEYWENYWYYRSGNETKLIPDSLVVVLDLVPSIEILPKENYINTIEAKYQIISTLVFKYGRHDKSYNVISPKVSKDILLLNDTVDLEELYFKFIDTNKMGYSFPPKKINIKEVLDQLKISIEDGKWDYEKRGNPFALNQIIIYTTFISMNGDIECTSEFTFPISGAYNNTNAGKWEF